ncbi:MAG: DUF308 domain-containing protein [Mycoplasmataceae bacterium]|jgi:hypothetical protein|nr:DUF308 domain-containing protein [Mycoplasmataceae bacterium]
MSLIQLASLSSGNLTLLIVGIVFLVLGIIQIIFAILDGKARKDQQSHIALGVLQILFGSLISGILVLIRNKTTRTVGYVFSIINCIGFVIIAIVFIVLALTVTTNT